MELGYRMDINSFIKELQSLGNFELAIKSKLYHKSQREHFGLTAPVCEKFTLALVKTMKDHELIPFARALWDTNLFDVMLCAAKIVCLPRVKPSKELWDTLLHFLKSVDGWALEDCLCHAAWKCILADASLLNELEEWTQDSNFWIRRAALVYTLPFAKSGRDPERSLKWASRYASDPQWFIQKAIGWWLRDLGKHNPDRVILFLERHWDQLKGVARKEATRKLEVNWQEKILQFQNT